MGLYLSNVHRQSHAARTDDHRWFSFVVVVNVGWHVGSPLKRKRRSTIPARTKASPPNVAQSLVCGESSLEAPSFSIECDQNTTVIRHNIGALDVRAVVPSPNGR